MLMNYEKWLVAHPRWAVAVRTSLVVVGGYALASALSLVIAGIVGVEGRELNTLVGLVFFLIYTACFVWWFSIHSNSKVLTHVVLANLLAWIAFFFIGARV